MTSFASRSAVTGDHSAGLCTTVQPAASAGAIFQVESMNGVFHGVITPTGPIGTRVETFQCSSLGHVEAVAGVGAFVGEEAKILGRPDRGLGHEAMGLAGVDAFEHGDIVGAVLDGVGDAMQQLLAHRRRHVAPGLEGLRRRRRGAIDIFGVPRATVASTALSIGDLVSKVSPEIDGTILPSIRCPMPSAFSLASSGAARSRLACEHIVLSA